MDRNIVKTVLKSSRNVMKHFEKEEDVDELIKNFPVVDKSAVVHLASSLTDLLTHKVSQEAYQRYSVRLQLINTIREWTRLPLGLDSYQIFYQGDHLSEFIRSTAAKYLSEDNFEISNINDKELFTLGQSLVHLASSDSYYIVYLKRLLDKIFQLNLPCNDDFIHSLIKNEKELKLDSTILEKLYIVNSKKFVEEPLINFFIDNCHELIEEKEFTKNTEFEKLINLISSSSKIFTIAWSILSQLFLHLNHSLIVLDYIQFLLKNIMNFCDSDKKKLIDLYPIHLQSCVILMKIEPCQHSENSKKYFLETLSNIYLDNNEEALRLLLHYPSWLNEFYVHMKNDLTWN